MRFRLKTAHNLQRLINNKVESVLIERGTVVDAAEFVQFAATPAMEGLDPEGEAAILAVCDKARANLGPGDFSSGADIPGFGNSNTLPGGDLHGLPPTDP